jgi:hypothetical protein
MKFHLKQEVIDQMDNVGIIVDSRNLHGYNFYQVLFDKDWGTEKINAPDFLPEESLRAK